MTAPRVWKRGLVSLGAVLVVVWGVGVGDAHAEVKFRKKPPAASSDSSGLEGSPSGGEPAAGEAAEAKPADSGGVPSAQADDKDFPEAQAQKEKARADAALARQARNAQLAQKKEQTTPFYQKWQFWAITGGAVIGAVALIWGGSAVYHQMNGGDIRACSPDMSPAGCYGEGR
jgi:hypothetical protein